MPVKAPKGPLAKGFTCKVCKKYEEFSGYVYAHWSESLTYTCDCGTKYDICKGKATKL